MFSDGGRNLGPSVREDSVLSTKLLCCQLWNIYLTVSNTNQVCIKGMQVKINK